jgi:tRNA threonylcarbamoyladenosine biosynthesis protein TsaB
MLLAIDTSGKKGYLALVRVEAGQQNAEMIGSVPLAGGTFSAQLVPQISALLEKHRFNKKDISAFAVVSGPGSFTGLRVGLAAVKALAEVLQKPIAAVSMLEAIAGSAGDSGRVIAALDAGRGEVYVGKYEVANGSQSSSTLRHSERLLSSEELVAEARGKSVVTCDETVAEILSKAEIPHKRVDYPGAAVLARLGWAKIQRCQTVSPEGLEANYIRRSDAEIFSQRKA